MRVASIRARDAECSNKPERTSECPDEQTSEHHSERGRTSKKEATGASERHDEQNSEHQSETDRAK